jgi:hypothetical protein
VLTGAAGTVGVRLVERFSTCLSFHSCFGAQTVARNRLQKSGTERVPLLSIPRVDSRYFIAASYISATCSQLTK